MPAPDGAYLSILQWPAAADEDWCVSTLAAAASLNPFTARQMFRRGVPQVVAKLANSDAARAVESLHKSGVTAMAFPRAAMRAMPDAIRAKRLIDGHADGPAMYAIEAWRGDGLTFQPADLFLLIRASLRTSVTRSRPDFDASHQASLSVALGPDIAVAAAAMDLGSQTSAVRNKHTTLTEVLDIHLKNGARARITGDKFNFDILATARGLTPRENIDKLAVLLAEHAPRAVVDTGFDNFRCPPEITRDHFAALGTETTKKTSDLPAFEFYSTWVALMYRAMISG